MAKTVQCDSEQSQTEALNVEIDTAGELSTPKLNQGSKATEGQLNTIHMRQRTTKIKRSKEHGQKIQEHGPHAL